jgi:predicted ATP-dependent protease
MLRKDVVDAVREGKFNIWAVSSIDEGIEILTGVPAGEPDAKGRYPPGSINRRAMDRLAQMARRLAASRRRRRRDDTTNGETERSEDQHGT